MLLYRQMIYTRAMKRTTAIVTVFLVILPGVCIGDNTHARRQQTKSKQLVSIYIVRHAWHAGIIFQKSAIDTMPVLSDFPDAVYLEVGWGDADYYMNRTPGFWVTFKAAVLPTMSTLHVAGFERAVTDFFPGTDIIQLDLSKEDLTHLIAFINEAFAPDEQGRPIILESGLYGTSYFYKGSQHYYAFKNCNTWVARALNKAGIPISPLTSLTVNQLLARVEEHGKVIQETEP